MTASPPTDPLAGRLEHILRGDAELMHLLQVIRELALPQWRVVAGCIYQTVWNVLTGRPQGTGINDYDLIYFDRSDLSTEAEECIARQVSAAAMGLVAPVEARNQARVHLWFEDYFGIPYSPLSCADESLRRYATVAHAVGVRLEADDRLDIDAPFGLDDLFNMIVRPNRVLDNKATHNRKAARIRDIWPEVTVVPWD